MFIKPILAGMKSYFTNSTSTQRKGRTIFSEYCYSVWLRHISIAYENGLHNIPKEIGEIGPGGSFGTGLAALISGTEKYYGLDIVKHVENERTVVIFDELVDLFRQMKDIPDDTKLPRVKPLLESYCFPNHIFSESNLLMSLRTDRINRFREDLLNLLNNNFEYDSAIHYICPWNNNKVIRTNSLDMIFSQAVLEHIDDLENTYSAMNKWLKNGGFISHQIDFKSHGTSRKWNGHWAYSDFMWKIIKGNRPYLINREPLSTHIKLIKKMGFKIINIIPCINTDGIKYTELSRRYKNISSEDFNTSSAHIIAQKN